jgi:flagellin
MASFSVVTNIASVNAQKELEVSNLGLQRALERLSSGLRINRSGDDAAGLAVANDFRSRVSVLTVGVRNANDALSRLQTSDSALNNIAHLLDRAASLAAQSASGGFEGSRTTLDAEFQQVMAEINREASVARVGASNSFSVFIGGGTSNIVASFTQDVTTTALGLTAAIGQVDTAAEAATAVAAVSTAIANLGVAQGQVGQAQNRLQFAIALAQSQIVNIAASESRIRDANIAQETANLTRYNILTQSGLAALANANTTNAAVLSLLG